MIPLPSSILDWFREKPQLLQRCVASAIAVFAFIGGVIARTLVLFGRKPGTIAGCVAADVALLTIMFVILAVVWLTDTWEGT